VDRKQNPSGTLCDVEGLRVGHWSDPEAQTGCTVVVCPDEGCVASGEVRGGAPGTRETALLAPEKSVQRVHAVVLSGGSAFGLAAAIGVVEALEARGVGFHTPFGVVPIVPAAVIYDLGVGRPRPRPDADAGRSAFGAATTAPVAQGRVGAGAGACCGKYLGFERAEPSGLGSAARTVRGAVVAALSVANPVGDLIDPLTGAVVAGGRLADGRRPSPEGLLEAFSDALTGGLTGANTTLVVVATDAPLSKTEAHVLAQSAHVGIARVTRPSHTPSDGDTTFALSTGRGPAVPLTLLAVAVQEVVAEAILRGVAASRGA
jgi:L-aminopeptidase/D-esterase-like protein